MFLLNLLFGLYIRPTLITIFSITIIIISILNSMIITATKIITCQNTIKGSRRIMHLTIQSLKQSPYTID